ncbi:MAG TPA: 50S ribosomal protein L21e [Candidatus Paceibacterota bacterium]|nr:50S ribosomal protein L21e [Candidatus Paceibacterota bacterium]
MPRKKHVRERGKLNFSEYFKDLKVGEKVALVKEPSVKSGFHKRMQGRTGVIIGKQGRSYIVKVNDLNMEKKLILPPIHLKRIKTGD